MKCMNKTGMKIAPAIKIRHQTAPMLLSCDKMAGMEKKLHHAIEKKYKKKMRFNL